MPATIQPFPWRRVPAFQKGDLELERAATRAIRQHLELGELPNVLNQLFMVEMSGAGVDRARVTSERRHLGCQFLLRGSGMVIFLSFESALVAQLVRRVMGQPPRVDSGAPLGPATTGAALAILAEVARRIARGTPLAPDFSQHVESRGAAPLASAQPGLAVDFWIRLDGVSHAGFVSIVLEGAPTEGLPTKLEPTRSSLPVSLALVLARCELDAVDYHSLTLGDVVLPSDPAALAWVKASSDGTSVSDKAVAWLCSPGATRGLVVSGRGGKLCLAGVCNLSYDTAVTSKNADESPTAQNAATDVILDAPVVVHLELGSVTLSAQSWLDLHVGDVVCSGIPMGRSITLRVADRAVAEGELVTVDGQVGVRIQRFLKA